MSASLHDKVLISVVAFVDSGIAILKAFGVQIGSLSFSSSTVTIQVAVAVFIPPCSDTWTMIVCVAVSSASSSLTTVMCPRFLSI